MTTDIWERKPKPPKIKLDVWLAVAIETAIIITFFANSSIVGIILCIIYSYFSATRAVLFDKFKDD